MKNKVKLSNKKIILTGGSGFIGSHLLESLLKDNKICIIDNEYRGSNLEKIKKSNPKLVKNIFFEKCDIRKKNDLLRIFKKFKPEIVFHLAGIAGVSTVYNHPMTVIDVNLLGSYNLGQAILETGTVEKLVYSSTSEVYGPTAYQLNEDSFTTQGNAYDRRWAYSTSKLFAEHVFVALEREYNLNISIGRLFNIYGPKQIGDGAIHFFIKNAISNKSLTIYDDGAQIRAWCYAEDCIQGLRLIAEKGSGIYNIGNPYEALTTIGLAKLIIELLESKSKLQHKKLGFSDIRVRVPNIEKISKIGFKPRIELRDGILKTAEWYKKN